MTGLTPQLPASVVIPDSGTDRDSHRGLSIRSRKKKGIREEKKLSDQRVLLDTGTPDVLPGVSCEALAGIDEAGRGCLAGPVVAAAVIFPPQPGIEGLADSKLLSPTRRSGLAAEIGTVALAWGVGVVWPAEIDRINILQATFKAMCHACTVLKRHPQGLLIDGNKTIPERYFQERAVAWPTLPRQKAIIDGDALVPLISAASILAKNFRDMLMTKLDRRYPGYGFAKHKGYGSKEHLEALRKLGPSPMHRLTFRGVMADRESNPCQGSLL